MQAPSIQSRIFMYATRGRPQTHICAMVRWTDVEMERIFVVDRIIAAAPRPRSTGSADEHSTWRFVGMDGELAELIRLPRLCTDDLFTLRRAALQGIGAVLSPHLAIANDLESGTLVRLLPSLKAHVGVMHDTRGARAPRPPLRDCAPAPELASRHNLYFGAPPSPGAEMLMLDWSRLAGAVAPLSALAPKADAARSTSAP
jgi:hypothetical protein